MRKIQSTTFEKFLKPKKGKRRKRKKIIKWKQKHEWTGYLFYVHLNHRKYTVKWTENKNIQLPVTFNDISKI